MTDFITYLFQVSCVFSLLYLLYKCCLEKLTFHSTNRMVLIGLLPLSLLLPFFKELWPSITPLVDVPVFNHLHTESVSHTLKAMEQPTVASTFSITELCVLLYILVVCIYLIRIITITRRLNRLENSSVVTRMHGYRLVSAKVTEVFSYFDSIFIPHGSSEPHDPQIIKHECAHISLKHSWDVIFIELYIALFWFNPLVYVYRTSLRAVHEFQADKAVLQNGVKTSEYMGLLLQSLELKKPNSLYNYFNQTILKKRVDMMTKSHSKSVAKWSYLLVLPLCALLMSVLSTPQSVTTSITQTSPSNAITTQTPSLFPVKNATHEQISAYYKSTPAAHTGIDIKAPIGTPIVATADGRIAKARLEGEWGNLIVIIHADGFETWYAHLDTFNTAENQRVKKGAIIGYVGTTGKSNGPHLHYEVKQHGKHLNPLDYLK